MGEEMESKGSLYVIKLGQCLSNFFRRIYSVIFYFSKTAQIQIPLYKIISSILLFQEIIHLLPYEQ